MSAKKKVLGFGALGLGVMIAGLCVLYWFFLHRASKSLEEKLAALQAAGEPVSLKDLARTDVDPKQNAAVFLIEAGQHVGAINRDLNALYGKKGYGREPLAPEDRKTIQEALAKHVKVLELLKQAASCSDFYWGYDYSQGTVAFQTALINESSNLRGLVNFLRARALLQLAEGQRAGALDTCLLIFWLTRCFERLPLATSHLMVLACRTVAIELGNQILRSGPLDDATRNKLDAELAQNDGLAGFQFALKSDRAFGLDSFREVGRLSWFNLPGKEDASNYLDGIQEQLDLFSEPYQAASKAADARTQNKAANLTLSNSAITSFHKVRGAADRTRAKVRCLRVLNALQRLNKDHSGPLPDLASLGLPADAITDPFDGQRLRIKKTPNGWVIYSVGPNLTDDGGDLEGNKDVGIGPVDQDKSQSQSRKDEKEKARNERTN